MPGIDTAQFLEVVSMVVTWWMVAFLCSVICKVELLSVEQK